MAEFDDDFLQAIDFEAIDVVCSSKQTQLKMENELQGLNQPPVPGRFAEVGNDQLSSYFDANQSTSTKRNTRWGMKIFQDWHPNVFGDVLDLDDVPPSVLSYCEARPQDGSSGGFYHKNTLKNIRGAINRHLQDLRREIDIVRDKDFVYSNRILNGLLTSMTATGLSKPTKHKQVIPISDLVKIQQYMVSAPTNPIVLRQCVWYQLAIHFCSRWLEFHHQLNKRSFEFLSDENGHEYVKLTHETCQKNFQGGLQSDEAQHDKRMYATGQANCPVEMLPLLIKKTVPKAQALFNSCVPNAEHYPQNFGCWFDDKPIAKRTFANFLPDICMSSNCSGRYTAHCLRATAITRMNDAGFEARHIMFMSGHRNESCIRSYNRNLSSEQKQLLSRSLCSVPSAATMSETDKTSKFQSQ